MKDHTDCKRTYVRSNKAWYSKNYNPFNDVVIGMTHPDGGTSGEFIIEWEEFDDKYIPRLKCFDDGWSALWEFRDLLEKLAEFDDENINEDKLCDILDELGVIDITEYERGVKANELK